MLGISAFLIYMAGCSKGESFSNGRYDFNKCDRVAVVGVSGNLSSETAQNQIADFVGMELLKKGYSPVERAQVVKIFEEQNFQGTGLTTPEGAANAGRLLNVQSVILVNIPRFGENVNMTVKMINVEDGSIIWIGSGSGTTNTLVSYFKAAIGAGSAAGRYEDQHNYNYNNGTLNRSASGSASAIGGGIVGRFSGRSLTPQEEIAAQKVIKKIFNTLPSKI